MWKLTKIFLFFLPPESAHEVGKIFLKALTALGVWRDKKFSSKMHKARFALAGFTLESPLGIAAGFDKNAEMVWGLRALGFGFVEVGTVTPLPQGGNPPPRLFRLPEQKALINRMGFNGEGVERVRLRLERVRNLATPHFPIGINLGKNKITPAERAPEDYVKALKGLYDLADYAVVNLSSPNTPGLTDLQEGRSLEDILRAVRIAREECSRVSNRKLPLFLKISPDLADEAILEAVGVAAEEGYGIIAANTTRRRSFRHPLEREEGGLSGAPLAERAKALLPLLRREMAQDQILISAGGILSADDVEERLALGANLAQVYTGFIYSGPSLPRECAERFGAHGRG